MIRVAICDDEKYMLDRIRKMTVDFFRRKNMEIAVAQFSGGKELLEYHHTIDILLLDIRMKDIDGMETAIELRKRGFRGVLIFITVLKEMVFQAFAVRAYDYLVKPVEEECFERMMERLLLTVRNAEGSSLLVQKGYTGSIISFDDIIFCEIIDRKVYLHLRSGEVPDYYERIEKLEEKLDSRFFRCHRSYLINLKYLKSYKNGAAYMEGDVEIPVSRLRSRKFADVVLRYMKEWRM